MTFIPNKFELAWAAGFFDGEGSACCYRRKRQPNSTTVIVSISQVNRDNLDRFRGAVANLGNINGPYVRKGHPNKRPHYQFDAGKFGDAQAIIVMLWQWLGQEKRGQALAALRAYKSIGCHQSPLNRQRLAEASRKAWSDPTQRPILLERLAYARSCRKTAQRWTMEVNDRALG